MAKHGPLALGITLQETVNRLQEWKDSGDAYPVGCVAGVV